MKFWEHPYFSSIPLQNWILGVLIFLGILWLKKKIRLEKEKLNPVSTTLSVYLCLGVALFLEKQFFDRFHSFIPGSFFIQAGGILLTFYLLPKFFFRYLSQSDEKKSEIQ